MSHSPLTPVFTGLRLGLHALVAVLLGLVLVRVLITGAAPMPLALVALFAITYASGARVLKPGVGASRARAWLAVLLVEWLGLLWLVPEAAYLAFALFFLLLHLIRGSLGVLAVAGTTAATVVALGLHTGWSVGGVVGPIIGAAVAVLIGLGYGSLARESVERERLLSELVSTRDRLAATEHESGVLAERARLARDIHDTVAQSLSSIHLLLHAAERADADRPGIEHVRLARETAAGALADTRRFIAALTPAPLDERGLASAVERLADTQWRPTGLTVHVRMSDELRLPMHVQTAFLRIIQGAMANVVQHAAAISASIELATERTTVDGGSVRLRISDDGVGFAPTLIAAHRRTGSTDSFGLTATRERVEALGGTLEVHSAPGAGTTVDVELRVDEERPVDEA